jgi:hypothetical protein
VLKIPARAAWGLVQPCYAYRYASRKAYRKCTPRLTRVQVMHELVRLSEDKTNSLGAFWHEFKENDDSVYRVEITSSKLA